MPAFGTGSDFPLAPTGQQEFVVSSLRGKDFNGNAYVDKNGKPQMRWTFSTSEVFDENGEPFKVNKSTGCNYGGQGSFLTLLLEALYPKLSFDQRAALEVEDIVGTRIQATVYHQTTERGTFATFDTDSIVPLKGASKKPTPTVKKEEPLPEKLDDGDPFSFSWE